MKGKSFWTIAIIVVVCVIGWNVINDDSSSSSGGSIFSSGLEKSLAETLPEDLTTCYCIDNNGEKVLNTLEVKNLVIDRQTTNENLKTADCTIEMEGNDLKMTAYVTLDCIKYDDGSWQVASYSQISEPKVVPKYQPEESNFTWNIQRYEGFTSLNKINEHIDLENGEIVYFFSVLDTYDYMMFSGEGVSCSAVFQNTGMDYNDKEVYYWKFTNENNMQVVWDVLGTWHIDGGIDKNPPYTVADIAINAINSQNAGVSSYAYPESNYKGEYLGTYKTFDNKGASCITSGTNPLNAKCEIYGYKSSITITAQGVECSVGDRNYAYKNVTKK